MQILSMYIKFSDFLIIKMIQREKLCPICEQNVFRHFLCFDCHISFCRDCVKKNVEEQFVCGNCGESFLNSESSDTTIKLSCKKCGSESIEKIQKISGICPACGSKNISDIEGFRSYLKKWVQSILVNTKGLIVPLIDYFEFLKSLRTHVVNARKELPIAHHYSNLEKDLLHQLRIFTSLQKETEDLIEEYISEIIRNFDKVLKIDSAEIDELPVLDEYISRFQMSFEKAWSALQNLFVNGRDKLVPIVKKLDFIESIKQRFMQFTGLINQEPNEYIVYCCECKINQTISESDVKNSIGKRGILFITTKNIEFLYEQGVLKKTWTKGLRIPIHTYKSFEIEGMIFKSKILQFENDKIYFNIEENRFAELITWLNAARSWRSFNIQSFDELNSYDLNAEPIKQKLENYVFELLACFASGEHPGTFIKTIDSIKNSEKQRDNVSNFNLLNEEVYQTQGEYASYRPISENSSQEHVVWQAKTAHEKGDWTQPINTPYFSSQPPQTIDPNHGVPRSGSNQDYSNFQYQGQSSINNLNKRMTQFETQNGMPESQNQIDSMNPPVQMPLPHYSALNIPIEQNALMSQFPVYPNYPNPYMMNYNGFGNPIPSHNGREHNNIKVSSIPNSKPIISNSFQQTNNLGSQKPPVQPNHQYYPIINPQFNQNQNLNSNHSYQQFSQPGFPQMEGPIREQNYNRSNGIKQNKQIRNQNTTTSSNPVPPPRHKKMDHESRWINHLKNQKSSMHKSGFASQNERAMLQSELSNYKTEKSQIQRSLTELNRDYCSGLISHVDFFKAYQYFQKNLYMVDCIIKNIEHQI